MRDRFREQMRNRAETSKAAQEEHNICNDALTKQKFSYIEEAQIEGQAEWQRCTKERLVKLELQFVIVNRKLAEF